MPLFRKTDGKLILMLEIQSSLVRGSIVWLRDKEPPHFLFTENILVPYKAHASTAYFIKTTLKALHEMINTASRRLHIMISAAKTNDLNRDMPRRIGEVHYVLSSPWVASQAKTISLDFGRNTRVTEAKVFELLDAERKKLAPAVASSVLPVEEKIFDVRLNGYSVSTWRNKEARELQISYALTVSGVDTVRRLRQACERAASGDRVFFHSSLMLQYAGLRVIMPERNSYTLIHVHGELSEVAVVGRGSCLFFGSYPTGINGVIRKMARVWKTDQKTADSMLSLYLTGRLDDAHARSAAAVINGISAGWSKELAGLFKGGPFERIPPAEVIFAARLHEDLFLRSLKAAYPAARIEILSAEAISSKLTVEKGVEKPLVAGLDALAIHSMYGK